VLGDRVATWTTLNEPFCSAYLGYASGAHAPGVAEPESALRAVHSLNLAHGLAISELKRHVTNDPAFSVTLNFHVIRGGVHGQDEAARRIDALANRAFTGPMLHGEYPADLIQDTAAVTDWSFVEPGDLELIRQPIDVLGVNYYATTRVRMWDGVSPKQRSDGHGQTEGWGWPGSEDVEFLAQDGPQTDMGWNIAPDGLEDLLVDLAAQFPGLPLMVTENGAAFPDTVVDGRVHDALRTDYLRRHFTAAHRAMARGVDLRGYLVWSLLDNFEWGYGYSKRFGIVRVDYDTQERIVKDSALWLAELIRTREMPALER
jgi:beta-glucosidase